MIEVRSDSGGLRAGLIRRGVSTLALVATSWAIPAFAADDPIVAAVPQDQAQPAGQEALAGDAAPGEDVVVTGIRASLTSARNIKLWWEDYGQLGGPIRVNITNNIKIGVQGTNLLNTRTFLDVGGAVLHPRYSWTDTDRRIAGIIRTSF